MFMILALICIAAALVLLVVLSIIDLKTFLLPNEYVMGLAIAGALFHLATAFQNLTIEDMLLGACIGGGFLYLIRAIANRLYKKDALGLGDVKLLAAGGVWLGPLHILEAITVGALAGVLHGIIFAFYLRKNTGTMPHLSHLSLPAGPGFAIGLFLTALFIFVTNLWAWPT